MDIKSMERQEFLFWKNKAAILKKADLSKKTVRLALANCRHEAYCDTANNQDIRESSSVHIKNYIKAIQEQDKKKAFEALKAGVKDFKDKTKSEEFDIKDIEKIEKESNENK